MREMILLTKILCVDTSTSVAGIAVCEDTNILAEYTINTNKTHSQRLMLMIEEVFDRLDLAPSEIDVFAAVSGPGSFTGLRIGICTVKAMAYVCRKPVVSVPTLDTLAYNISFSASQYVCPMIDARNNQVYTAIYKSCGGMWQNISGYMAVNVSELSESLKSLNASVTLNGDGVFAHKDFFISALGDKCSVAPYNSILQRPSTAALIAYDKLLRGEKEDCMDMVPFYLRKSQAERLCVQKTEEKV